MTADPRNPLLTAPTHRVLLSMSAPIAVGMLSTFLFQVIDTWFVGQLGPAPLAALAFAATVYFFLVALLMGLAVGVSALVGAALGAGRTQEGRRYASIALGFGVVVTVALAPAGVATVAPLFGGLGAGAELLPLIDAYIAPLYLLGALVAYFGRETKDEDQAE